MTGVRGGITLVGGPTTVAAGGRSRRLARLAALVVAVVGLAGLAPSTGSAGTGGPAATGPTRTTDFFDYPGARLGAHLLLDGHNGWREGPAYRRFEAKWERRSDLIRVFVGWDTPSLFTRAQRKLAAEGRTLVLSWNSYDGAGGLRWSEVASGSYDAMIDARAEEIIEFGLPMLFTFQHEPDNRVDLAGEQRAGTPADFCNAYRRVVDRFRAAGVTNATYGVITMAWTAATGDPEAFYCGDDHVDYLAVDGYNWYGCVHPDGPWRMPVEIFSDWYEWARTHDKPLVIAEWGTGEDAAVAGRKATWIRALRDLVKERPEIKGAIIYNTSRNPNCPRYSDTSRSSQRAFIAMGADPYFNQAGS